MSHDFIYLVNIQYIIRLSTVPERYEKCLRVSSLMNGKPLPIPPRGREWESPRRPIQ